MTIHVIAYILRILLPYTNRRVTRQANNNNNNKIKIKKNKGRVKYIYVEECKVTIQRASFRTAEPVLEGYIRWGQPAPRIRTQYIQHHIVTLKEAVRQTWGGLQERGGRLCQIICCTLQALRRRHGQSAISMWLFEQNTNKE